ncbi:MAG: hypothetical protein IJW17_11780 [Lentisphaeria bacterium]|nr:hypothetical protein [Lentisphaeria bacterium]
MNIVKIDTKALFRLSPNLFMQFAEPLGTADSSIDAAWDFLHEKWQDKAIEMVKKLNPPMIRWGGCFASYYHWKDAVGPQSGRKPMYNLCWDGVYLNQVGTAEIAELARMVQAEMLFCVNFESDGRKHWAYPKPGLDLCGTAQEAAEWVRYCNDPDDPLRKSHGFDQPFNVRYWQIGNETSYVPDGFSSKENAATAKRFVKELLKADPGIKLILWGDGSNEEWQERFNEGKNSYWAEEVIEAAGDGADYIAFHNHWCQNSGYETLYGTNFRLDADATWQKLLEGTVDFENRIGYMRRSVEPYGKKLAMTEAHMIPLGKHRGDILSTWGAGAAYARCANVIQRNGDILDIATLADFMGNRWQNNAIMLPTPANSSCAYFLPAGTIMQWFSEKSGDHALAANCENSDVDIAVSRRDDRIFVHAVNLNRTQAQKLTFQIAGAEAAPVAIQEIKADILDEITVITPELFTPQEVKPNADGSYTLPGAGVAVLEFKTAE